VTRFLRAFDTLWSHLHGLKRYLCKIDMPASWSRPTTNYSSFLSYSFKFCDPITPPPQRPTPPIHWFACWNFPKIIPPQKRNYIYIYMPGWPHNKGETHLLSQRASDGGASSPIASDHVYHDKWTHTHTHTHKHNFMLSSARLTRGSMTSLSVTLNLPDTHTHTAFIHTL